MSNLGYLHRWIQVNYKRLWPAYAQPPRFLGSRDIALWGQEDFQDFGKRLVSRFEAARDREHTRRQFQFGILDEDGVGAWVVWPSGCYGILVTKGLVRRIQRIAWELQSALPSLFNAPVKGSNFLKDLWGDLPQDANHFLHFGGLVAHIAFSFIVHHELAHAGLGHEGINDLASKAGGSKPADRSCGDSPECMDEFAGVLGATSNFGSLSSQALETDADVHAMLYTRSLLHDEAAMLHESTGIDEDAGRLVWRTLLRDVDCEQLMLFIGSAVGLLSMLRRLESSHIGRGEEGTHPPLPSRLLLAFHVEGSIQHYQGRYWENRSAAIATVIVAIAEFEKEGYGTSIDNRADDLPLQADGSGDTASSGGDNDRARKKWRELSHLSIVDAMLRVQELGPYWEELVIEIRRLAPALSPFACFPNSLRYEWYGSLVPGSKPDRS